jgi:penicillin amidase
MIVNAPGLIDISYFQQMQGDNFNQNAQDLMPVLMNTPLEDQEQIQMRELLAVWDYQEHMDSPEAALWEVFWKHLLLMTFDELPEDYTPGGGGRWFTILRGLVQDPTNVWWDVQKTDAVETRDDIFAAAFATAVHEIRKELGQDPAAWRWGDLHRIYFNHAVMDSFPFIRNAFNQGPFPVSGGSSLVNNTSWKVSGEDYRVSGVSPSQRLIVDFSDFQNTLLIHPTGQSGHSGHPNYIDMAELWTHIQYNVLGWLLEDIQANAAHHLQLKP